MMTDDKLSEYVPFDTNEQTACSPTDPGIDWLWVKVRAPSQVFMPDKDAPHAALIMPLCGIYMINVAKANRHPGRQVLIVTDDLTGQTYRGEIVDRDPNLLIPPPKTRRLRAEDFEQSGYESNEVRIAVVQRR